MEASREADSWAERWERDGYFTCPGRLDAAAVAGLLQEVRVAEPLVPGPNELSAGPMVFRSNLFHRSPLLQAFLTEPGTVEIVTAVLGPDVWCRWDQAVCKRPGSDWFPWHQDNGYTRLPDVHLQLWVALTPSHERNGGLLVAPGSHRAPLPHEWVGSHVQTDPGRPARAIEAEPGDVIAFSSLLAHATGPNVADEDRWAYVAEFLPLGVADHTVATPHFVVARGGAPAASFVDLTPTWASPLRLPRGGPGTSTH